MIIVVIMILASVSLLRWLNGQFTPTDECYWIACVLTGFFLYKTKSRVFNVYHNRTKSKSKFVQFIKLQHPASVLPLAALLLFFSISSSISFLSQMILPRQEFAPCDREVSRYRCSMGGRRTPPKCTVFLKQTPTSDSIKRINVEYAYKSQLEKQRYVRLQFSKTLFTEKYLENFEIISNFSQFALDNCLKPLGKSK